MKEIQNYLRAGFPALAISTHEEGRAEAAVASAARAIDRPLWVWSVTQGLGRVGDAGGIVWTAETQLPDAMLSAVGQSHDPAVIILRDIHAFIGREASPLTVRAFRDAMTSGKQTGKAFVFLGHEIPLPPEIVKEVAVIEWKLPSRDALREVITAIAMSGKVKVADIEWDAVLDAAAGLTVNEAEAATALSVVETQSVSADVVRREKSATVRKNGILEIVESKVGLADIGGLELLKAALHEKRNLFGPAARAYGIPTPPGTLVVGQPGTGKSLTAQATASTFRLPLLRLEAGRLFGSLVGQSEANWRSAFATAKAVAPCILWIDEVDGLFAGSGSGTTDGGTTQRVLKAILQDMQFSSDGIFFFFTANDIDRLPDPLIDRLEVWGVDLPNAAERAEIWKIQIAKRGKGAKGFDAAELARVTDGFSGRQIAKAWVDALTIAFNAGREPKVGDCLTAAARITPTSKTMSAQILARRERLAGKAAPASAPENPQTVTTGSRRLTV